MPRRLVLGLCAAAVGAAASVAGCGQGNREQSKFASDNSSNSMLMESDSGSSSSSPGWITDAGQGLLVPDSAFTTDDGGNGGTQSASLTMTIRDFKMWDASDSLTNPDFENATGDDRGIVEVTIGSDGKPVYAHDGGTRTTHGPDDFSQWYNDIPEINIDVQYPITLVLNDGGLYGYDSLVSGVLLGGTGNNANNKEFFPIDDGTLYATAFGNQGERHNYSFTTELHTVFTYNGGEIFSFSGDDDVFVFINDQLVIDLGGIHNREQASVMLDSLNLAVGNQYRLDLFGAERHMTESNLSFETTLHLQPPPPK